jgi:multidrug resistance efflux pump
LEQAKSDLTTAQSELADAVKQHAVAQEAMRREESIAKQGLRNAREVDSAKSEVDIALSELSSSKNVLVQAQADLGRARAMIRVARDQIILLGGSPGSGNRISISAPISGEVEHRDVSVGQTVVAGQKLYDLLNAEVVWILCDVYEMDVSKIKAGQKAEVYVDALAGAKYTGEIAFVHNEVDPSTRTTKVRIVVENRGEKLKQNMFVRVQLGVTSGWQLLVPTAAIQKVGGADVVFVEETPGTYRKSIIRKTGNRGANTVVESGVMLGSKVVTDGSYQLASLAGN